MQNSEGKSNRLAAAKIYFLCVVECGLTLIIFLSLGVATNAQQQNDHSPNGPSGSHAGAIQAVSPPGDQLNGQQPVTQEDLRVQEDTLKQRHIDAASAAAQALIIKYSLSMLKQYAQRKADDERVDKQAGGGNAASGGGNPIALPGLPDLVAFGISSGAVTQTISQGVATYSMNGDGAYRLVTGQDPVCPSKDASDCNFSWLKSLSIAASFNATNAGSQTVTGSSALDGTAQSAMVKISSNDFSSASIRFAVINTRAASSNKTAQNFKEFRARVPKSPRGQELSNYIFTLLSKPASTPITAEEWNSCYPAVGTHTTFLVWECKKAIAASLQKAHAADLRDVAQGERPTVDSNIRSEIQVALDHPEVLETQMSTPEALSMLSEVDPDLSMRVIDTLKRAVLFDTTAADHVIDPMLTLDYSFSKAPLEPDYHNFTMVLSLSPKVADNDSAPTFTANLGASIYHSPQPINPSGNMALLRSAQAALQFDRAWKVNQTSLQLSLGGYFQYQINPSLILIPAGSTIPGTSIMVPGDASSLLAPKGFIGVAEATVTIHLPNLSTPIPLGFTWSNRTDIAKGGEFRVNIGINFDSISLARMKAAGN